MRRYQLQGKHGGGVEIVEATTAANGVEKLRKMRGHVGQDWELICIPGSSMEIFEPYLFKVAQKMTQWTPATMGRKGGKISKRKLTPEQAKAMVAARESKRKKIGVDTRGV